MRTDLAHRRARAAIPVVAACVATWLSGCSINPQPLPPEQSDSSGGGFEFADAQPTLGDGMTGIDVGANPFPGEGGSEGSTGIDGAADGGSGDATVEAGPDAGESEAAADASPEAGADASGSDTGSFADGASR